MSAKGKANSLPENVVGLLAAADKRNGFPAGTMASVMQQEVGGDVGKYLNDPSTYHYGLNPEGKRVAGHTGKVSTAFGPFGILESTGRDPGYGVKPLQNKSLDEQVRFAADYLAARTKAKGGDLSAGLAGYGEGAKYAGQVVGRLPGGGTQVASNTPVGRRPDGGIQVLATTPASAVDEGPVAPPVASLPPSEAAPVVYAQAAPGPNAWDAFIQTVNQARGQVTAQDLNYAQAPVQAQYQQAQIPMPAGRVNFGRPVPQAPGGNRIAAMKNFVDMADWGHFVG